MRQPQRNTNMPSGITCPEYGRALQDNIPVKWKIECHPRPRGIATTSWREIRTDGNEKKYHVVTPNQVNAQNIDATSKWRECTIVNI